MMAAKSSVQIIEERSRKRRIISAITWFPPREGEYDWRQMAMKNENSFPGISQFLQPTMQPTYFPSQNPYQPMVQQIKTTYSDTNIAEFGGFHQQSSYSQQSLHNQDEQQRNIESQQQSANAIHLVVLKADISTEEAKAEILLLLDSGLPLNILNEDEETPLFVACRRKNLSLVVLLMELGANPCIMNKQYSTCLHQAVYNFDLEMVEHLLKSETVRAEINVVDFMDRTPLMITAMEDAFSSDIADLLVTAGASVSFPGDLSVPSYRGRTPLHYAALYGNTNMIRFLINKGANVDATDRENCTPLFLAARAGRLDSVMILVEMGASQRFTDQTEKTPYQVAIDNKWTEIIEFFHSRKDTVFVAKPAVIKPKLRKKKKVNSLKFDRQCKTDAEDDICDTRTRQMLQPVWHQNLPKIENMMTAGLQWHPNSSLAFSRESCNDRSVYYADGNPFVLPKHGDPYKFM